MKIADGTAHVKVVKNRNLMIRFPNRFLEGAKIYFKGGANFGQSANTIPFKACMLVEGRNTYRNLR
jgi:hypothetical protein